MMELGQQQHRAGAISRIMGLLFFFLVWAKLTTGDQRRRGPCRLQLYLDTYRVVGDAQKSFVFPKRRGLPFSADTRAASGDFCKGRPGG